MKPATYIKKTRIKTDAETLFAWHARDGAIQRLTPPWAPLKMISRTGNGIDKGVKITFRIQLFKIPMPWVAEHIEYVKNRLFKDRQTQGPFALWEHTHRFIPDGNQGTIMEDEVKFKLPLEGLSAPFYRVAQKEFDRMFGYRHRVLKADLEGPRTGRGKKRILISGGSGTIGNALIPFLQTRGHEVIRLVRDKNKMSGNSLYWDPPKGILDLGAAGPIDAVINLNGVDISKGRWTGPQKKKIIDSRVLSTQLLAEKIKKLCHRPKVFISSSAIGYYGEAKDRPLAETAPPGECFISDVCNLWEKACGDTAQSGIRTVCLRTGVVLTPAGGALKRMELPFKIGLGAKVANGRQYMSWISMDDALWGIDHILENTALTGAVNLASPNPVTNIEFSQTLARVFGRRVLSTLPRWVVSLVWGEMGRETLLASARVMPEKLVASGFSFQYPRLFPALRHLLGR